MKKLITIILFSICFCRVDDASCAKIIITDVDCRIQADGYIGAVQMTLAHGADFSIDLTYNALVADYQTTGNETILVIVVPENDILFTYSGEFQIVDLLIANSRNAVSTECSDYNWSPDFIVTQTDVYGNIISYDENDWLMPEDTGMINTISIPYPNPSISDGTMNVVLNIAEESQVTLTAYNQSGIPYIIINDNFIAGAHIISFELEDGFYHCIFESGDSYIEGDIQFGDLILGCTNQYACNYDEDAINDDNSCLYNDCNGECDGDATFDCSGECNGSDFSCGGCTDEDACNYDEDALLNDGTCLYRDACFICDATPDNDNACFTWDEALFGTWVMTSFENCEGDTIPNIPLGTTMTLNENKTVEYIVSRIDTTYIGEWGINNFGDLCLVWDKDNYGCIPIFINNNTLTMNESNTNICVMTKWGLINLTISSYEDRKKYSLDSCYPNPFNPTTTITFSIPEFGLTSITAYDLTGRYLETLTNEILSIGNYSINWNASSYPSGVYLIKMESGEFTQTQKVVLVK